MVIAPLLGVVRPLVLPGVALRRGLAGGNSFYSEEQRSMQATVRRIVEEVAGVGGAGSQDINPYVDEWEKAGQYPAHTVRPSVQLVV